MRREFRSSKFISRIRICAFKGIDGEDAYLDEEDRKLLFGTKQKLDKATKLMSELVETLEVLADQDMINAIKQGQADIKAGKVKELRTLLKEEAH